MTPDVKGFFDPETFTISYVVSDPESRECAIIDPVLDFDMASGRSSSHSADCLVDYIKDKNLHLIWILETHVHADHLSSAAYIQERLAGKIAIGKNVTLIQDTFGRTFNEKDSFQRDGSQFDHLFEDEEIFQIGGISCRVMFTPGHTPACVTYVCGEVAFVGDTLFMPDYGTARCDFPGGNARQLYHSIQDIYDLPDETRLFMCHDYAPGGREFVWQTTIREEKEHNIHISWQVAEDEFVRIREQRDKDLTMPLLIIPSIQINMRGGQTPEPEDNGKVYLKVPYNVF